MVFVKEMSLHISHVPGVTRLITGSLCETATHTNKPQSIFPDAFPMFACGPNDLPFDERKSLVATHGLIRCIPLQTPTSEPNSISYFSHMQAL